METDNRGHPVAVAFDDGAEAPFDTLRIPLRQAQGEWGKPLVVSLSNHDGLRSFDRLKSFDGLRMKGVAVEEILDRWRIDDEWWRPALQDSATVGRAEISRMYYHVALRNRRLLVIFRDLIAGGWYVQTNATPLDQPEPVQLLTPRLPTTAARSDSEQATMLPIRRVGVGLSG